MITDLRLAIRSLARAPGFTTVAVLTLALGIGLSTTVFNGVNPLLFRSLPFHDPASLVYLTERNLPQGFDRMGVAYADFVHWRRENRVFADVGLWDTGNFALGDGDVPERVEGGKVSANLFATLGLQPVLGRSFTATEDQPGAAPVVLLGHGLWQRRFGGDPSLVGRTIALNGQARTVVGIMPPRVRFPTDADLWVPVVIDQPEKTHGNHAFAAVGRLKPGITRAQAAADLAAIHERIAAESPQTNAHVEAVLRPIEEGFIEGDLRTMGWTMLGTVAFVLGVACANVASLFLTRALGRQKEFAVRAALGASGWRTTRQLLAESLVLGALAGTLGFLFSLWGLEMLLQFVPVEIPSWIDFSFDWRVGVFAIGVSLVTSVLFGLAPAWQAARVDVQHGLAETGRGGGGRQRHRLRRLFVVAEVAFATLLLCGTGLMIRSLLNLQQVAPGFNPVGLAVFSIDLTTLPQTTTDSRTALLTTFIDRLRALPGVRAAAACSRLPLSGGNTGQVYAIGGQPASQPGPNPVGNLRVVTPGYFAAMEIPLLRGRDFTAGDAAANPKVVVIDTAFARKHFGADNPLGHQVLWDPTDPRSAREIVGVAADVKHAGLDRTDRAGFYIPFAQSGRMRMAIVLRAAADEPLVVLAGARQALREVEPTLPLYNAQTMVEMINESFWIRRFLGRLLVAFAAMALALAAVGIASVVGYAVTQRTREIGVRMALGAQPADIQRLILGQALGLVGVGLAIGLVASLGLARLLESQLFGVGSLDPLVWLATAGVFAATALLAGWWPARRAARITPVVALRAE